MSAPDGVGPQGRPPRVGLLGGTFDPPHIGHLAVAVAVRHALRLDRVLLVVANDPWQKRDARPITAPADRLAMTRAAAAGLDGIEVDDREIIRGGPSYTVDTVRSVLAEEPQAEVFVVVGQDAAAGVATWDRSEELAELATFVAVARAGVPGRDRPPGFRWTEVEVSRLDVSSTELRARVQAGMPIDVLVPAGTVTWIEEHRLYCRAG